MQSSYSLLLLWGSAPIMVMMAYQAGRRRGAPGAAMLATLLYALAWWQICLGMMLVSRSMVDMLFWTKAKYLGVTMVAPAMLGFVIQYTRRWHRFGLLHFLILMIFPAMTLAAIASDSFFHLFYSRVYLIYFLNHLELATEPGLFFWLHTGYAYLLLLIATTLLGYSALSSSGAYRKQQLAILVALMAPWLASVLALMYQEATWSHDLTSISFLVTVLMVYRAIYRYRLLEITPIARNAMVEQIRDGMLVLDHEQRILDLNPTLRKWLGMDLHAVVGRPVTDILPAEVANRLCALAPESTFEVATRFQNRACVLEISCSPILAGKQDIIGQMLILRDVTQRRQVEESLWEAKELLERMFNSIHLLVVSVDNDLRIIRVNKAFAACVGSSPDDLLGMPFIAVLSDPAWNVSCTQVLETGEMRAGSGRPMTTQANGAGTVTYWDWSLQPVCSEDGKVQGLVLTMTDVTERKLAEEELQRSEKAEREQRIMAEAFRDMAATLNSTIELDGVLSLILSNIERVVAHDAAYVLLLNAQGDLVQCKFSGFNQTDEQQIYRLQREVLDLQAQLEADGQHLHRLVPDTCSVNDVQCEPSWARSVELRRFRSYLCTPIRIKGRPAGYITLASKRPAAFSMLDAAHLRVFADQAAIAVENARLYDEVQHLTLTDELTQVYNYRGLMELGPRECERARRFKRPLSLIFLDIDHFRKFNNLYSHELGNQVLQQVAEVTRETLRSADLIARFGGEEFVVLLPETNLEQALVVAERVRFAISSAYVEANSEQLHVTVSIGVAELNSEDPKLDALIRKANQAEHCAKRNGRNCVVSETEAVVSG